MANKAALLLALGGKPKAGAAGMSEPDSGEPDGDEAMPSMGERKSTAARDVMGAFKSGDAVELEDALTRFVQACSSEGYE